MEYLEVKDKVKITILILLFSFAIIFIKNLSSLYNVVESHFDGSHSFSSIFIFSVFTIFSVILTPIPTSFLSVVSGAIFGPLGYIISLLSFTLGSVLAFLIGRYILHDYFYRMFKKNKLYKRILQEDRKSLIKFIFYSRFTPYFSVDLVSYFAGITNVKIKEFALASFLGFIPIVIIFGQFGHLFESLRIFALYSIVAVSIFYSIYKIIIYKRYYVKGY